jgi:predicted outer membrane repeat protein
VSLVNGVQADVRATLFVNNTAADLGGALAADDTAGSLIRLSMTNVSGALLQAAVWVGVRGGGPGRAARASETRARMACGDAPAHAPHQGAACLSVCCMLRASRAAPAGRVPRQHRSQRGRAVHATQRGGAVYVVSGSTLNITGKLAATGNTASPVGDSASGGGWAYVEVAATLNIACPGDVSLTNNQPDAVRAELFRPDFTGSCDACHGDISNAGACACRRAAKRLCAQHPLLRCVCSCPPLACRRCARCAPTSHRSLRAHRRWLGWLRTAGLVFHFGPGVRLQRRLRGRHQRQLHGLR